MLAYIDPGMGSLVWQTIISAFIGTFFYLKKTRVWFVGIFQKCSANRKKQPQNTDPSVLDFIG